MDSYVLNGQRIDSVDLKCMVVSRGVKVGGDVYRAFSPHCRLDKNPLACNCMLLPDGTIVQLTDMGFHLKYLTGALSWDNLKLLRYASELGTPFSLSLVNGAPVLCYESEPVTSVSFFPKTDFYRQKTASGLPFMGNAVIQGCDWVAFQCLWPCEYAASGKPCEFCFSGGATEALAIKKKPLPGPVSPDDMAQIADYAAKHAGCNSVQITGGSTFSGGTEAGHIRRYLSSLGAIKRTGLLPGETLLYITPPDDTGLIDEYFSLGASRVACSLEVWDEGLASGITPGKICFTTRQRHISALEYIASKYGPGKAFSNFVVGLEGLDTLREGVNALAQMGVIPTASVWMPMGRPVRGSMKAPDIAYYRAAKELFADAYTRHGLEPAGACGLNVCIERDIWRYATG